VRQAERILQREVVTRLTHAPLDAVLVPVPNGFFIPARDPQMRVLARRLVHQLKLDGQLQPGVPDLLFLWASGSGAIELKRPPEKMLFGKHPRGVLSPQQKLFQKQCVDVGVGFAVCETWPEVRDVLISWGRLPAGWREPEARRAA